MSPAAIAVVSASAQLQQLQFQPQQRGVLRAEELFCLSSGSSPDSRCGRPRGVQRRGAEGDAPALLAVPERRLPRQHQRRDGPGERDPGSAGPVPEEHGRADGEKGKSSRRLYLLIKKVFG